MEETVKNELRIFPKTLALWEEYLVSGKSLENFHKVACEFNQEINKFPFVEFELNHFYKEIGNGVVRSLKCMGVESKKALKALQTCLNRGIFVSDGFDDIIAGANRALQGLFESRERLESFDLAFEVFKTLAYAAEKIIHLNDRKGFRENLQNTTTELLNWVGKIKNEKTHKKFLGILRKLVMRENLNIFSTILLEKKCVLPLITIIKYYFFESFLFTDLKPYCEEELIFELYYFLIQEYRNDFKDLCLEDIMKELLNNDQNMKIVLKIFDKLLIRIEYQPLRKDSLETRKIVLDLVLNLDIEKEMCFKVFKKMQKLEWSNENIPDSTQIEIKALILSSKFIANKTFFLELISPWLSTHISVQDLKLLTRLCSKSPNLTLTFLLYLLDAIKFSKVLTTYFQISQNDNIIIYPYYNIRPSKEFSIWAKILPDLNKTPNPFFSIQINKSIILNLIFNQNNFKIEMTKGKKTQVLLNAQVLIEDKNWNLIGISFFLRQKVGGRWKIVVNINDLGVEMWLEEIGVFKELSVFHVIGPGKVEFVNLYNKGICKEDFIAKSKKGNIGDLSEFEVFKLNSQDMLIGKNIKFECRAGKVNSILIVNVLLAVGGINFLLPLLRKTEEFEVFELFFKVLTELSSFKCFEDLFDHTTFVVLKHILIEKAHLVNIDWLGMCESLFVTLKSAKIYRLVLENVYCCADLWGNLLDQCLVYYLEAVKNRIKGFRCELTENYLSLITCFFTRLSNKVANESKKLVFYYFFQVLGIFFKSIDSKIKLDRLVFTLKQLLLEVSILDIPDEAIKFIKELFADKWEVPTELTLNSLNELALQSMDQTNQLCSVLLSLYLKLTYKFYTNHIQNQEHAQKMKFIEHKLVNLILYTKPYLDSSVCQVVCDFLIKPKVIDSPLKFFNSILLDSLYRTSITSPKAFEENLNILIFNLKQSQKFSKSITIQPSFPGFFFCFFQDTQKITPKIVNFITTLFSHLENFKNFEQLREIFYELIETKHISTVFKILIEIYQHCFSVFQLDSKLKKYFFEYFNVVEDVIARIYYDDIPADLYLEFVLSIVKPLRDLEISFGFPNISAFTGLNFADRKEDGLCKQFIVLRAGGLIRQILPLVFIGLSFGPNPELEIFFEIFSNEKLNNSDNRCEWRGLENDFTVKKSKILPKVKKYECINLIFIYIFVEWSEIIKSYEERGVKSNEISFSLSNLIYFIHNCNLPKRIQEEARAKLSKEKFKDYEKSLNDNWNQIDSFYIKENINSIRKLVETQSLISQFIDSKKVSQKQEKLLIKTIKIAAKLEACKTPEDLSKILLKTSKKCETTLFFILLTTFKMSSIFQYYTGREINYRYIPLTIDCQLQDFCKDPLSQPSSVSDYQFMHFYSSIETSYLQFCGLIQNPQGELTSRPLSDMLSRRIFTKKKPETEFFTMESLDASETLNLDEHLNQSLSFSVINSEQNSEFGKTFASQTIFDLDCLINNASNCQEIEFECEIIMVKGSLYGKLFVYDELLVFVSKNTPKPEFPIIKQDGNTKLIYSSAISESQILKKLTKVWSVNELHHCQPRNFVQNLSALEVFLKSGKSIFFNFFSFPLLQKAYSKLKSTYSKHGFSLILHEKISYYQELWQKGCISNFEYLMFLNKLSGRSLNDINQYPIFPWVLKDYSSQSLDLQNESIYRNFSLPSSGQTPDSIQKLKTNFKYFKQDCGTGYHHGSHYSSGGIVLEYLIRLEPYTTELKKLYNGNSELPDRVFLSLESLWNEVNMCLGTTRELIPEFFYLPELFLNNNHENFGLRQSGQIVWDVNLPPWANDNVFLFIQKHRQALESEHVSRNLHLWIDLIFGHKQRKQPAEDALNLFHPMCYSENYKKIMEEVPINLQKPYYHQAYFFGQVPFQLFKSPHPRKLEIFSGKSVFDRLLSGNSAIELSKKFESEENFLLLVTNSLFIILKNRQKIVMVKYKLMALGGFDANSAKECGLAGVLSCPKLSAVVFEISFIVTSGYLDFSIAVHNLNGELMRMLELHTMKINDLIGGKWIISGSEDSTLVLWTNCLGLVTEFENKLVDWTEIKGKSIHGHLSPVYSVSGNYYSCIIASCSSYILLHHSNTLEVLYKIQENCEKVVFSQSNLIYCKCELQIKVFYINGFCVKTVSHSKFKPFFVIGEFLVLEQMDTLKVLSLLEGVEREIYFQEPLDVVQVLHCQSSGQVSISIDLKKDYLLIQNSGQKSAIYSLDSIIRS